MHVVAPLIDKSSGESPLTVEYPGNGVVRFNAAIRVAIKRYNHAVTWATRHFISLISISKKYESNFKEISKLHLFVVIYECTSGQRKHRVSYLLVPCLTISMASWQYSGESKLLVGALFNHLNGKLIVLRRK